MRENAYKKGQPNLTAGMFCVWVNNDLLPSLTLDPSLPRKISLETAQLWLHELGFQLLQHSKGLYIDGHECADVVKYHKTFLEKLQDLEDQHLPPPLVEDPVPFVPTSEGAGEGSLPQKHLVVIHHDESTSSMPTTTR